MKVKQLQLDIMKPFKNKDKKFEKYFLKQMILKNQNRIHFSIILLIVETISRTVLNLLDNDVKEVDWVSSILDIIILVALCMFLTLTSASVPREHPLFAKYYLALIFLSRFSSRMIEIFLTQIHYSDLNW